jgi:NhaP-type Na+/H+ or K+/H+ antiporter
MTGLTAATDERDPVLCMILIGSFIGLVLGLLYVWLTRDARAKRHS